MNSIVADKEGLRNRETFVNKMAISWLKHINLQTKLKIEE